MALPRLAVGSALLGAAAIVAAGNFDPGSGFASAGVRLARASFEGPVNADVVHVVDGDTFEARAAIWLGNPSRCGCGSRASMPRNFMPVATTNAPVPRRRGTG